MPNAGRCVLFGLVSVSFAGCLTNYPVIRVTAAGSLQHAVVFYFSDLFRDHPPPFEVTRFEISERLRSGDDMVIWEINGKQALRSITYGAKYPSLKEARPAPPLQRGKQYSVYIDSNGGYQLTGFRINEAGNVVQVPWR